LLLVHDDYVDGRMVDLQYFHGTLRTQVGSSYRAKLISRRFCALSFRRGEARIHGSHTTH
jgi:hypothetical protein